MNPSPVLGTVERLGNAANMGQRNTLTFDVERARSETPGAAGKIHFNNAGASLMPRPVLDAVLRHLQLESTIGGYEAADKANFAIEHTYDAVARLLNCR